MQDDKCAFAKERRCAALNNKDCINCKFRKSAKQLEDDELKARARIEKEYGLSFESFLDKRGYKKMQNAKCRMKNVM